MTASYSRAAWLLCLAALCARAVTTSANQRGDKGSVTVLASEGNSGVFSKPLGLNLLQDTRDLKDIQVFVTIGNKDEDDDENGCTDENEEDCHDDDDDDGDENGDDGDENGDGDDENGDGDDEDFILHTADDGDDDQEEDEDSTLDTVEDGDDDQEEDEDAELETLEDNASPSTQLNPEFEGFETCEDVDHSVDTDTSTIVWYFHVESDSLDQDLEEFVCEQLKQQIKDGILVEHCERRRLERRLGIIVQGVSSEVGCSVVSQGGCDALLPESETCSVYTGEATIIYTDTEWGSLNAAGGGGSEGDSNNDGSDSFAEVEDDILDTVEAIVEDDGLQTQINDDLNNAGSGTQVTDITYVGTDYDGDDEAVAGLRGDTFVDEGDGGLNTAGKVAVGIMSLVALLLLTLCCLWKRSSRRQSQLSRHEKEQRSLGSGTGGTYPGPYLDDEEESYLSSDFNNLGLHHSKLDVHECTSATCRACMARRTEASPEYVSFVSSKGASLSNLRMPSQSNKDYNAGLNSLGLSSLGYDGLPNPDHTLPETIEEEPSFLSSDGNEEDMLSDQQTIEVEPVEVELEEDARWQDQKSRRFGLPRFGKRPQSPENKIGVQGDVGVQGDEVEVGSI